MCSVLLSAKPENINSGYRGFCCFFPAVQWGSSNIMLLNGCFHAGPVTGLRTVVLALELLYWPKANTTASGPVTGPMCKHPFHDIFVNQHYFSVN